MKRSYSRSNEDSCIWKFNAASLDKKFPKFSPPKEIGHLSVDADENVYTDDRYLSTYLGVPPQPYCFDITEGFSHWLLNRKPERDRDPEHLLRWIMLKFETDGDFNLECDFVCWRGLLSTLLTVPHENLNDWSIAAIKICKVIYLLAFKTETALKGQNNATEIQLKSIYGGHRFEDYLTKLEANRGNKDCSFATVVKSKLNDLALLYAGEVDGIEYSPRNSSGQYVELKTTFIAKPNSKEEYTQLRYKHPKWWTQSFLANINKIVVGEKNNDFKIENIKEFSTREIYKSSKKASVEKNWGGVVWKPNVSFNFLYEFLLHIKELLQYENENSVYVFFWQPKSSFVKYSRYTRDSNYYFIPDWYRPPR